MYSSNVVSRSSLLVLPSRITPSRLMITVIKKTPQIECIQYIYKASRHNNIKTLFLPSFHFTVTLKNKHISVNTIGRPVCLHLTTLHFLTIIYGSESKVLYSSTAAASTATTASTAATSTTIASTTIAPSTVTTTTSRSSTTTTAVAVTCTNYIPATSSATVIIKIRRVHPHSSMIVIVCVGSSITTLVVVVTNLLGDAFNYPRRF
mmetsp:Transcript_10549/g.15524  ORF Transcript_10549/g.15524 Transcript_10549/m.15524 type:complete len:206 (-) Transcript_10549:1502-2119(-)